MSTISDLTFWQQLLLAGLALISFVYVFYFKIWVTLAAGSDLVFVLALVVALASVAAPTLFESAANRLVERSALSDALVAADEKVAAIEALPRDLIDRALQKLGYEPEEPAADAADIPAGPGPFESRIRPSVEALVAAVLRAASFVISTLLLLMALSLRSSTSTARALQNLAHRTTDLEKQLADTTRVNLAATRLTSDVDIPD